jgi:hypothetical protein
MFASAAAAAPSAGPAVKERYVVVIGDYGVGKSHFINTHLPPGSRAPHGDSARPVTVKTTSYVSRTPGLTLVDTVGTNLPGYDLGLPLSEVEGKNVHFVIVLNNTRWQQEYEQKLAKLSWARIGSNVSRWAAFEARFATSDVRNASGPVQNAPPRLELLKDLAALKFEPVAPKVQRVRLYVPTSMKPAASVAAASAAAATGVTKINHAQQWFGKEKYQLSNEYTRLHDFWIATGIMNPGTQRPMASEQWMLIQSEPEIQQHRQKGEALLELHLLTMFDHKNHAQNEPLLRVIERVEGLKAHIDRCYRHQFQSNQELTPAKYADYIEALFLVIWMKKKGRRCVVDFIRHVIAK